ncbi:2Fe-2S iron-sulfur cluster-binding protein [Sinimarinibacterium flocculans]|uniref:2Fe-2S iron-sulfur cluster-binding protein n=1 Tax=Sinimarinibacterium flocculans TaxID=985250 RepID=UPI0024918714|nr:2Fe-2S iron-sulfur cluster binding domain-containing protein [Sinimarinibacterium flocculans]
MRIGGRVVRQRYYPGETLVETARRAGAPILTNCLNGQCGTCMVQVRKGCVRMRKNSVLTADDVTSGLTLACQGIPQGSECEIEVY